MRVGHRVVDLENGEVLGFVDYDLRGAAKREYEQDPEKWHRDTNTILVAALRRREQHPESPPP